MDRLLLKELPTEILYDKIYRCQTRADVVELADTRDLKSLGGDFVPVQARSSAPNGGSHYGRKKSDEFFSSAFLRHVFASPPLCR